MFRTYPPQCGPNITFYEVTHSPKGCVHHGNGCGGTIVQIIPNYGTPVDAPGKIFCFGCGMKVGKKLTATLKRGVNQEGWYLTSRKNWDLVDLVSFEEGEDGKDYLFRYWKFREKQPEIEPGASGSTIGKPKRKVVELGPKVTISQDDVDWIVSHPRAVVRLPQEQFNAGHAIQVHNAWMEPQQRHASREWLVEIAMHAVGIGPPAGNESAVLDRPDKLVILHPRAYVIMDKAYWNLGEALHLRNNLPNTIDPTMIRQAAVGYSAELGRPTGSVHTMLPSGSRGEFYKFYYEYEDEL